MFTVCAAWTVSVFGEGWGWLARTTEFADGVIIIRSTLVDLSPGFERTFLYVTVLTVIVIPSVAASIVRAAYLRADEKERVLKWQLQQLLPEEVRPDTLERASSPGIVRKWVKLFTD
jgi:hypothetical protein